MIADDRSLLGRLEALEKTVDEQQRRIEGQQKRIEGQQKRIEGQQMRVEGQQRRIETLESTVREHKDLSTRAVASLARLQRPAELELLREGVALLASFCVDDVVRRQSGGAMPSFDHYRQHRPHPGLPNLERAIDSELKRNAVDVSVDTMAKIVDEHHQLVNRPLETTDHQRYLERLQATTFENADLDATKRALLASLRATSVVAPLPL